MQLKICPTCTWLNHRTDLHKQDEIGNISIRDFSTLINTYNSSNKMLEPTFSENWTQNFVADIMLSRRKDSATNITILQMTEHPYQRKLHSLKFWELFWFFKKYFGWHVLLFGIHWYPCFGFPVMSPLRFKSRVGNLAHTWVISISASVSLCLGHLSLS